MKGCKVPGCKRAHDARGYCSPHYKRVVRYGNPLGKPEPKNPAIQAIFERLANEEKRKK